VSLQGWIRRQGIEETFGLLAGLYPRAVVFAVDADRNGLFWNDEAERVLGFTRAEMLGANCLKGIRCPRCLQGCGIAERGRVVEVPAVLHRADGARLGFRKTAQAVFDAEGRFAGGVEVLIPDDPIAPADLPPAEPPLAGETFHGMVSRDPALRGVFQTIRNVAQTDATVLVRGESGTGKELVARAIHAESARRSGPFVAVNCASLTPSLMESELFGHVRGAFTGAVADRSGIFVQADGGTLFLDEVAEIPLELQSKLLRVLQERVVVPVGANRTRAVDVRVVSATHKALREEVRAGRFREDLMFRLRVVPLFLPALRERRTDIELLLWQFVGRNNERGPRRVRAVAPDAMRALLDWSWPGNVRELQNVVDYAFAVGRGPEILSSELPPEFREPRRPPPEPRSIPSAAPTLDEAQAVRSALEAEGGHVGRAAARMGVSRPTFWRMRKRLGV
jgi:two-component system response regulator AtoC